MDSILLTQNPFFLNFKFLIYIKKNSVSCFQIRVAKKIIIFTVFVKDTIIVYNGRYEANCDNYRCELRNW